MEKLSSKIIGFAVMLAMLTSMLMISPMNVLAVNTTYYVDSVNGSDSNNGTSESTPWKTLTKVNSVTYGAGDQIKFKAGCSWAGTLTPVGSGTSGSPIIMTSYGSGAKPIIDGAGATSTMTLNNQQYWELNGIEIQNNATTDATRRGLYITATDAGTLNHIYVLNCTFKNIRSKAPNYSPGSHESAGSFTGGIVGRIFGSTTPTRFNDVKIDSCTFENTDRNMFYFFDSPWYNDSELGMSGGSGAMFNSTNVVVSNNYCVDAPGTGTCLCSCDGAIVEYNTLDNCQWNVPSGVAGVACSTWSCQDVIYQYNEVMNTHGTADGQSFDNDGACRNCIFQYNYSHDNNGGFYLNCSLSSCKVYNGICRYNISQNDKNGIFDHRSSSYNSQIYNNTIYTKAGLNVSMFRTDTSSNLGTATFSNNIFYNQGGTIGGSYGSGFTWRNNTFYGNFSAYPSDSTRLTSDPRFVNPGSGSDGMDTVDGYKLYSDSPCINSGILISNNGGKDYWGNNVSTTAASNRGAYNGSGLAIPAPSVPTGLTAVGASSSQISVTWAPTSGATGYDLMVDGTLVINVTNPYTHTGLATSSTHTYQVRAKNSVGTSGWSSTVSGTTLSSSSNLALNKTATANSYVTGETPAKAIDGSTTNNSKWCSSTNIGSQWLRVDLGSSYTINRWIVKHAGAGGEDSSYNTKDFKLQRSTNGTTWTDVDSVTSNTASTTDRTVTAFTARYVRLYITNPQTASTNKAARIYEFEVYGN